MKIFQLFMLLILSTKLIGQKEIKIIDSGVILNEAVELYQNEDFANAIEKFNSIHYNDTNYIKAQYNIALVLSATKDYHKCITVCEDLLKVKNIEKTEYQSYLYNILGFAYDKDGAKDKAIATYEKGLSIYSENNTYLSNIAITYLNNKEFIKGLELFKNLLLKNSTNGTAHKKLSLLALNEGKTTQALLSAAIAPIFSFDKNDVVFLDNIAALNVELKPENISLNSTPNSDSYEDLDLLLKNKISLDKKYKTNLEYDYPTIRQLHLLINQYEYDPNDKGFWSTFYGPYFKALKDENKYEGLMYLYLTIVDNEDINKKIAKKLPLVKEFYAWHQETWNKLHNEKEYTIRNEKKIYSHWYSKQKLEAIGNLNAEKENYGLWHFFQENGKTKSIGEFANNKRTGFWQFYNLNGTLDDEVYYKDGKLNGPFKNYDENGNLRQEGNYVDDLKEGTVKIYYEDGSLYSTNNYIKGKQVGEIKEFYPNGDLSAQANYNEESKLEGSVITYFANKQISSISNRKNAQ